MTASKQTRPTPQSLPKLTIPTVRYKQEPEEITVSRVDNFLKHCREYKRAPITRLPSWPLAAPIPATNSDLSANPSRNDNFEGWENLETCADSPEDPQTLAFTANEWDEKDAKEAELKDVKAKHTEWYNELVAFPGDRNAIEQCKHYRLIRERLLAEIDAILKRREFRREFRRDYNRPKGVENW
ncbi:hypothetical protein GGR53DRAFT_467263 [Hypoxylon sp. FL1150]|nr:hypothetical protein GGR53DRAFT_467263 [Hypoxylon sp. FL1150]